MNNIYMLMLQYERYSVLGNEQDAAAVAEEIYAELINEGFLPDEIGDSMYMGEILCVDYRVRISDGVMEALLNTFKEISFYDQEPTEGPAQDEAGVKFIVIEHTLDHIRGRKEMRIVPIVFDNANDLTEFLNFSFDMATLEIDCVGDNQKVLAYSDLYSREQLINVLLNQETADLEVIADNIPEDCEAACVISIVNRAEFNVETTRIYAAYKALNFNM